MTLPKFSSTNKGSLKLRSRNKSCEKERKEWISRGPKLTELHIRVCSIKDWFSKISRISTYLTKLKLIKWNNLQSTSKIIFRHRLTRKRGIKLNKKFQNNSKEENIGKRNTNNCWRNLSWKVLSTSKVWESFPRNEVALLLRAICKELI